MFSLSEDEIANETKVSINRRGRNSQFNQHKHERESSEFFFDHPSINEFTETASLVIVNTVTFKICTRTPGEKN